MTVDGTSTTYNYSSSPVSILIPSGSKYTISFGSKNGYSRPVDLNIYTAVAGITNNKTYIYRAVTYGVGIMGTDGVIYNVSSWTGGSNATGVTLITENVSIVIAPDEWYTWVHTSESGNKTTYGDGAWNGNTRSAWGGIRLTDAFAITDQQLITGIVTTTEGYEAILDFAGSQNTDIIIEQLKNYGPDSYNEYKGAPAAEYCRAYSKGCKGVGEWYLPAYGELQEIYYNYNEIKTALAKISGEALNNQPNTQLTAPYHTKSWSSTQYDETYAWVCDWNGDVVNATSKNGPVGVRPICQIYRA